MISIIKLSLLSLPFLTHILATPESIFKRDDCHGSGRCGYGPGQPQAALSLYNIAPNNASIYNDYTSYTDGHYTAIWTCPKGKYPPNVTGAKIYEWGQFVYKSKQAGGASCGKCGTHWVPDSTGNLKCRVTMNYCKNCQTFVNNIKGGGAGLPPPPVTPSATPSPGLSSNRTSAFSESALLDPTLDNPSLPPLDPALTDPTLQDPSLSDPSLTDPTLQNTGVPGSDPTQTDPMMQSSGVPASGPTQTDPMMQSSGVPASGLSQTDPMMQSPGLPASDPTQTDPMMQSPGLPASDPSLTDPMMQFSNGAPVDPTLSGTGQLDAGSTALPNPTYSAAGGPPSASATNN